MRQVSSDGGRAECFGEVRKLILRIQQRYLNTLFLGRFINECDLPEADGRLCGVTLIL